MKRRNFFKGLAGLIVGAVIAPVVVEATKNESNGFYNSTNGALYHNGKLIYNKGGWNCHNEPISLGNDRYVVVDQSGNGNHCFYVDCCDSEYVSFPESKENFEPNPEDCRLVLFDANGESYEFPKNI